MKIVKKILPKNVYLFLIKIRDNCKYFIICIKNVFNPNKYNGIKIRSNDETIDLIVNKKMSLTRFGDGEFKWIFGEKQTSFQDDNEELSKRLLEVFTSNIENLMIGIPDIFDNLSVYNRKAKIFWSIFLDTNFDKLKPILDYDKIYANANITRPYIDYKNKNDVSKKYKSLKKIWDNRNIVIIEGSNTKLGVRNDLLNNAKAIERIICPPTNAFNKYVEILNAAKQISKDKLILVSLGPTATILVYDLTLCGYQVIDTGHIDIEYEWFLAKAHGKEKVDGKAVNEAGTSNLIYEEYDEDYLESIVVRIEE